MIKKEPSDQRHIAIPIYRLTKTPKPLNNSLPGNSSNLYDIKYEIKKRITNAELINKVWRVILFLNSNIS